MTFATIADITGRLGRDLTAAEADQVDVLLELASDLLNEAVGQDRDWAEALTDVPAPLRTITVEVVARVLLNPAGVASVTETLGAYSHTERFDGAAVAGLGLFLTADEERRARRAVNGATFSAVTLETPYSGSSGDEQPELLL